MTTRKSRAKRYSLFINGHRASPFAIEGFKLARYIYQRLLRFPNTSLKPVTASDFSNASTYKLQIRQLLA